VTALDQENAEGLSSTAAGRPVPTAWQRAKGRLSGSEPRIAWGAAIGIAVFALLLRLHRLGTPDVLAFDETYYAKDGWSLLHFGYVKEYLDDADGNPDTDINADIEGGHVTGVWSDDPSMVVHPEVGKWLIALGEKAFGMDPFGWRISAAVVGALMVLVMCRLARRLTGSTALGCVAGLLLSFDGLHFVLSRLALLDIFLAFFLLCGVACIVNDRDWHRARMARLVDGPIPHDSWGPVRGLLFRPWLLLAGVCFGLALGTKWTAIYPLAAFGLLVFVWSGGARKSFGVRWARLRAVLADGVPAFVQLVLVAGFVYVASWTGWLVHADEYEQAYSQSQYTQFGGEGHCDGDNFVSDNPDSEARWSTATEPDASGLGEVVQSLRSLWYYHQDVYTFHAHFLNCSDHHYESKPSGWLFINRPVGVAADTEIQPSEPGCDAAKGSVCYRQVLLIGTPVIWWGGAIALLSAGAMWIGTRDWRYGVAVVGALSTWLPWLFYDDRPIFFFYAITILPFLVLAITLAMGAMIGPSRLPSTRRTVGVVISGSFFVLALLNFAWFYPILSNEILTRSEWLDRIWFSRWV
jgi:dolichyl-phosphate-mannose-protein mannosyltransferase